MIEFFRVIKKHDLCPKKPSVGDSGYYFRRWSLGGGGYSNTWETELQKLVVSLPMRRPVPTSINILNSVAAVIYNNTGNAGAVAERLCTLVLGFGRWPREVEC